MNDAAKIHLSAYEKELVSNTEWIFTKQIIIKKVYDLFGAVHDEFKSVIKEEKASLPFGLHLKSGKITKGENYRGLPFVILDYPAIFGKKNVFAVRTMFWWGNFFSISLHISGEYFKKTKHHEEAFNFLKQQDFFICINDKEWEHHFLPDNFIEINSLNSGQMEEIRKQDFFKIAQKISLAQWESVPQFLKLSMERIIHFIKISYPGGEKVL